MKQELQCDALDRATGKRCNQRGMPDPEFDFFVCDGHLNELERALEEVARKSDKHANN